MIKTGVIGHPIAHSKSPLIHDYWMRQHGIKGEYSAIDIAPNDLEARVRGLVDLGYAGFNVTVPYKEAIFALCDDLDDAAQQIGAVNTVVVQGDMLLGRNTDAFGFMANLKQAQPAFDIVGKTAVVLGAGGAARAVVYGLLNAGAARVIITNRTQDKAEMIRESDTSRIDVLPWDRRHSLAEIDAVINTTSLGMAGKPALELELELLRADALVYDIVYAPLMTDLLNGAQQKGCPIVTGIGMLLHQARPAFEAWHGVLPDVDDELEGRVLI